MVALKLPDGSERRFEGPVTGLELAANIGPGLAKAALAININGELCDLATSMDSDCDVSIVTLKDDEALELIRHDTAHVLAEAVQELFPGTQVTIGPSIENGFYYDFARDKPFTLDDLTAIEKKMAEIIDRNDPFEREVWGYNDAIKTFSDMGEVYKAELIEGLPADEDIGIYRQGKWFDLCRGPHLPSTGRIGF